MSEDTTLSDYSQADGYSPEHGVERCPHCEDIWSMNSGMQGPAYTVDGEMADLYTAFDPGEGPFFCAECYRELETNRKATEHKQLTEFDQ